MVHESFPLNAAIYTVDSTSPYGDVSSGIMSHVSLINLEVKFFSLIVVKVFFAMVVTLVIETRD